MASIELSGLTKHYGEVVALQDVDLTVDEGEIFGFLGPNGAGKSTTINMLLDFVRPTDGTATVLGMDAQHDSQAVRRRVGVLPDGYHVYDRLTGRQHVEFAIESKGADDDPDATLERVGIPEAADRKAGGYSKGMKQRLVLAMALVGEPDLLILDEPTTGLDPRGARDVREIVREEADRGATVFFSSHILEQVRAVCDRVGILREGELVAVDSIDGLRNAMTTDALLMVTLDRPFEEDVGTLETVEGVTAVTADGSGLAVQCANGAKTGVIDVVEDLGYAVQDFKTEEASLEELFMAYTDEDRPGTEATADADADGETATQDTVAEAEVER
ncbi:MAG: ABC-2 type transport system ATP-binding protein [Halobacteriales archaeon]|jgi:ABC-2 type transport system ATP-binding protein